MYGRVVVEGKIPSSLSYGSGEKIKVKCLDCGEQFERQFRDLKKKHFCPTTKIVDNVKVKWCNNCQTYKPLRDFFENQYSCKLCKNHMRFGNWENRLKTMTVRKKNWSYKHKMECTISVDFLKNLWKLQNGLCYYSGVPMKQDITWGLEAASLDRIDSNEGYTESNTVWCTLGMNTLKSDSKLNDFLDFVAKWSFSRAFKPIRAEHKLIHPLAKTPQRSKDTDAGYDLSSIEDVVLEPGMTKNVRTGVVVALPPGFYLTIEGRSSLFKSGVIPARGIIDATYTGEMIVALTNQSHTPYEIKIGERIAQFIPHKCESLDIFEVQEISPEYNIRGNNGFGSTGK